MKKIFLFIALAAVFCGCNTGEPVVKFNISGDVAGLTGKLYLMADTLKLDSVDVVDGKFTFQGEVSEPTAATMLRNEQRFYAPVFLENGDIVVAGDLEQRPTVSGTVSNDLATTSNNMYQEFYAQATAEGVTQEQGQAMYEVYQADNRKLYEANQNTLWALSTFVQSYSRSMEPDEILAEINKFTPELQSNKLMDKARERAEIKRKTAIGADYINITMPDAQGNMLSLSDYVGEGKYVFVDFWASWCGYCIQEFPYLKPAYDKYHSKGFEIFAVSLDDNRENWLKSAEKHELKWVSVSDLKGWDSPVVKQYGIDGIPASYLIGPDGKIILRDARGTQLEEKLAELIK